MPNDQAYYAPQSVIDKVTAELVNEFAQRGHRLIPITQEDIDSALTRIDALLLSAAHHAHDVATRLQQEATMGTGYLNSVQLPGQLLDALTAIRQSDK